MNIITLSTFSSVLFHWILLNLNAIIFKGLYALLIANELRFNSGNNNNKNGTHKKINPIRENDIINEDKEYLSNHYGIKLKNF